MMKDKWICYIEKATHLALVWAHWYHYLGNMYIYIYIYIYISCAYLYQLLLFLTIFLYQFLLRLPPWKYFTPWFCWFVGCCCKVSDIDRSSSFGTYSECNTRKFEGIDASFFYILKVLWLYGILKSNFENYYSFW